MFYLSYFNTSHVTVYLIRLSTISLTSIFQYISCYCLSILVLFHSENEFISIHLMLLFIKQKHRTGRRKHGISIHLMLLFISALASFVLLPRDFNTSHVTVYLIPYALIAITGIAFQYISCYCLSDWQFAQRKYLP